MGLGGRRDSADFAEMFGRLLQAARLSPDKLVRELRKQGQPGLVERATVYDWRGGQHLADSDHPAEKQRLASRRGNGGSVGLDWPVLLHVSVYVG